MARLGRGGDTCCASWRKTRFEETNFPSSCGNPYTPYWPCQNMQMELEYRNGEPRTLYSTVS